MDIRKIRHVDGKETRIEYTDEVAGKDEVSEHKRVSKQKPETSFTDALKAFVPLVAAACQLSDAWAAEMEVTGLTFGEEKAKGGGARMNIMAHARFTPEGQASPIFLNTPLMRESREDAEIGKPGSIPAD